MQSKDIDLFIAAQLLLWSAYRHHVEELHDVRSRAIDFERFEMFVQFNPGRVRSTTADINPQKLKDRKCFLCRNNRPPQQRSIECCGYDILVNPFPIFAKHLTIAKIEHIPQALYGEAGNMLTFAKELEEYTVFYNGPESGASAPDHHHFQAVPKGDIPFIRSGYADMEMLFRKDGITVTSAADVLRKFIIIEGESEAGMESAVYDIMDVINCYNSYGEDEPRLNAYCEFSEGRYKFIAVPRAGHRPWQYYAEKDPVLFSPGAVDIGGMIVTVREEDYDIIDKELLMDMFLQVIIDYLKWKEIKKMIRRM
ncbi:MAG: DUF4922 domain-containing protein [Rikenellaceae bacterium]|nr:DUF4922 domain-containing protein [Rikenellaceae bacterium]